MQFGLHVSIAGKIFLAVDRATKRDCQCMQIFCSSPRAWYSAPLKEEDVLEFKRRREKTHLLPLVIHAPYLVNLASPSRETFEKSIKTMESTLKKAEELEAQYVVFHVGSHGGTGKKAGLRRVAQALSLLLGCSSEVSILLENTAGSGFFLGSRFEGMRFVLEVLEWHSRVAVCFDTCHGFAAGYDISTSSGLEQTLEVFDAQLGLDRLKLIHANDSASGLGSRIDRHEDIGEGYIGIDGFRGIVNHPHLIGLPCILETPRMSFEDDVRNLRRIRELSQV